MNKMSRTSKREFSQLLRFGIVGIVNTLVGSLVMFTMYNVFKCGYWISSATNYFIGSIVSYFLNKRFTFEVKKNSWSYVLRFAISIVICYLFAYGLAKKAVYILLNNTVSFTLADNASMLCGMVLFILMNYVGQKYFVFKTV